MGEIIEIAKLYGKRENTKKRLSVLSGLLNIKQEEDVVREYNGKLRELQYMDEKIFYYENRAK